MADVRNTLYIIRGLPGSGKSTFANNLVRAGVVDAVCEADSFFINENGEYHFDPRRLPQAHHQCLTDVIVYGSDEKNVAVANTFSRIWEFQDYLDLNCFHSKIVLTCEGNYGNIHGVPAAAIARMRERWESY